jgi:hypothetical protein
VAAQLGWLAIVAILRMPACSLSNSCFDNELLTVISPVPLLYHVPSMQTRRLL